MQKLFVLAVALAALAGCAEMEKMMGIEVKSKLVACPTGKPIGEVPSCGKVWKLTSGSAELKKNGGLQAEVKGLVLDDPSTGKFNGTPDGVDGVAAAVVCSGKVAAQTSVVPLSKTGDATVKANVSVPGDCVNPVIVLRERYEGKVGGWLAATSM